MVLAAVLPLGAAGETVGSIIVLTGLATAGVLVVPAHTLQLTTVELTASLCGDKFPLAFTCDVNTPNGLTWFSIEDCEG